VGGGGIGIAGTASAAGTAGAAAGGSLLGGTFGSLLSGAGTAASLLGLGGFGTGLTASAGIFSSAGLVGGFTGSINAGFASLAGGSIGQGLGLLAGPVGIVVGALALLSHALRDTTRRITVIGNDLVGTPGYRNLAPGSTYQSALGGFTFASIDRVSREERDRIGQAVVDFDNAIAKMLNGEQLQRVTDALAQFNLRLEEGAITAENILGARFNAILSTFDQSTQDFVNAADTLEERIKRLAEALERPMRIQAVLDALAEEDMLANMSEAERQIYAINKRFDELRAQLEEWGASEEQLTRLEEYRTAALDRAAESLDNATRAEEDRIAALNALMEDIDWDLATHGLSDYEVAVMRVNRAVDEALARAIELGASEEQLARIRQWGQNQLDDLAAREAERAQEEMTRYWEQVQREQERAAEEQIRALQRLRDQAMSLQAWLTGQSLSETSTLNPLQRLQVAQTDFANVISRALTGPVADIDTGTVTRAADEFLRQALSFYGPGGQYAAVEQAVRAQIAQLMLRMGLAPSAGFNVAAAMGAAGNVAANAPASGIAPAPVPFNTDATLRDVRDAIVQQGSRVVDAVRQMAYSSRQA
jgi:septum formation inhibitor MinC